MNKVSLFQPEKVINTYHSLFLFYPFRPYNGRWFKNPLNKLPCPSPIRSSNGYKFINLSTSNYEMAREIDMNLAEIDMETFKTEDIDMAFRLAYSSPINTSMIRVCGDEDSCILMNSLYYQMDR